MSRSTGFHDSWNGVEARQGALFHETMADALGSAVLAIGGPKKAAHAIWPADPLVRSETRLRACLNAERAEKLSPDEVIRLAKLARAAGDHSVMQFLAGELGYEITPIEPEEQAAALQRQFIAAVEEQRRIADRLTRLGVKVA